MKGPKKSLLMDIAKQPSKSLLISTINLQPIWVLSPAAGTQAEDDWFLGCVWERRGRSWMYLQTANGLVLEEEKMAPGLCH